MDMCPNSTIIVVEQSIKGSELIEADIEYLFQYIAKKALGVIRGIEERKLELASDKPFS